jgi:Tol biopolymer transport system component
MLAIRHSIAVLVVAVGVAASSDTTTEPSPGSSEPATTDVGRIMFGRAPGGEVVEAEEIDLWVTNADGSGERLLVAGANPGRWSPDGSEVSIFCCDDGGAAHLLNPDTGEVRRLEQADPALDSYCGAAWSPDGERLSCEAYGVDDPSLNGIYSVRASDGGDLTRITSNPDGEDTPGEYSPDGTRLVFVRFEDETPVGYFVTNVDGTGEPRQLTPDGMVVDDSHFGGSWSPSGDDILFVARESEEHHKAIWIVNADEGSPQQLPIIMPCGGRLGEAAEYGCYSPDWSPEGDRIVFTRSEPDGSNETIWIVNADGSNPVQVTDGTDDNPSWGPPTTT